MISYPGEILRRFGRYEAVEEIERAGIARLWGAWDPFLERFVIVVELPGLDPRELLAGLRTLDTSLEGWTEARVRGDELVLDFDPGEGEEPAYIVIAADEDGAAAPENGDDTVDEPSADADETIAEAVLAGAVRGEAVPADPDATVFDLLPAPSPTARPLGLLVPVVVAVAALLAGVGVGLWWR